MEYSIIVIIVSVFLIAFAFAYPYAEGILLKARMLKRLRQEARDAGYKYRRFYKNIFLVRNRSSRYDLIIYDEKTLYAVKLWSSYFRGSSLVLTEMGRVIERRKTRPVFKLKERSADFVLKRPQTVSPTRISKKYTVGRDVVRVLLIYPSYEKIIAKRGAGEIILGSGDQLFSKTIYSPSAFLKRLKSDSVKKDTDPDLKKSEV